MKMALVFILGILLGVLLYDWWPQTVGSPYRPPGHGDYMRDEYGSLLAFMRAEERIDAFLLELENK